MQPANLPTLYEKCLAGTATPAEKTALLSMLNDPGNEELLKRYIEQLLNTEKPVQELSPEAMAAMLSSIVLTDRREIGGLPRQLHSLRRWLAAASIAVLIGTGIYLWSTRIDPSPAPAVIMDIQPGRGGAVLTLANGKQVLLDTARNGIIALQAGTVTKIMNGTLVYEGHGDQVVYNKMSTPPGRQFQITLPDGTKVWLNSASSIHFPTAFTGNERKVAVTGEAYFEVAWNDRMPFAVNVNGKAEVSVLGTHFNINAYDNSPGIYTTLLQGAVRVTKVPAGPDGRQETVTLRPGQQAQITRIDAGGALQPGIRMINNANIEQVTAWKNGLFNFEDVPLEEVMRQLERWYDIEVIYENDIPDIALMGKITRGVTLNGLLKNLKELGLRYRLENRRLIIL